MGDAVNRTSIEWTDFTTNPIRYRDPEGRSVHGCIKVSAGCANCYASAWSARGLTGETDGAFTAKRQATLTPYFDDAEAQRILRTRVTGKRVFVGDMTDVFGEWVPDALLDRMFAVFAMRPDLTFQLLTKRPERMRAYVASERRDTQGAIAVTIREVVTPEQVTAAMQEHRTHVLRDVVQRRWPLPNVWLGVSVEDQAAADERIPALLDTPAAVRSLSCEPLLEPVDLEPWLATGLLHWVICGGES
jgi:protein gp37